MKCDAIFAEIDKEQTAKQAHRLLSYYRSMARLEDEEYTPKITTTFSLELKASGGQPSDQVGNIVARKVTAEQEIWGIGRAMNQLNAYKRHILHYRYIDSREMTDTMIYYDLNMSERTFYRELGKAQIEFAEGYDNGRLSAEI